MPCWRLTDTEIIEIQVGRKLARTARKWRVKEGCKRMRKLPDKTREAEQFFPDVQQLVHNPRRSEPQDLSFSAERLLRAPSWHISSQELK